MNKKSNPAEGVVFSTNPDFQYQYNTPDEVATLPPAQQKLVVLLDKKARAGKQVTLVEGFIGRAEELESLGKKLKTSCGVGGSAKDGTIVLQGDFRTKAQQVLEKSGYKCRVI
jgi:translation initiation factor 1